MARFSLREFAEFEAIAIGAGEYGAAAESARNVARYERFQQEEKRRRDRAKLRNV